MLDDKTFINFILITYYINSFRFGFTSEFAPRYIIRSEVRCKKTGRCRSICDYESPEDLHDLLVDFIHTIYFKYALISPKDRPIIIVESLLCPTLFRETLAKVSLKFETILSQYTHSKYVSRFCFFSMKYPQFWFYHLIWWP